MSDIELVIKIPEETYKSAKNGTLNEIQSMYICGSVVEGTPLPKGHGDLIDRKKLGVTPIDSTDLPSDRCLMVYLTEDVDGALPIIEADKEANNE